MEHARLFDETVSICQSPGVTRPTFRKRLYRTQLKKKLAAGVAEPVAKLEAAKISIEPPRKPKSKKSRPAVKRKPK